MKYIISENKLYQYIYKYIDDYYEYEDIHSNPFHDDDGNPLDIAIEYYIGNYSDDNTIFRLYRKEYWTPSEYNQFKIDNSPILMIEDEKFSSYLNSLFNKRWIPVFKDWFMDKFGEHIKTIDYYS